MNIDHLLITFCAPTLARLKMGALLCLHREGSKADYEDAIRQYNEKYNDKGLYFRILYHCPQRTLVYVYRPEMVLAYLKKPAIARFLACYGYRESSGLDTYLEQLARRFRADGCFPHESGIFLGYPLADVIGFIHHKGNNCKLCGEWKVYGDVERASHLFAAYACCRTDYTNRFAAGSTLDQLIVA